MSQPLRSLRHSAVALSSVLSLAALSTPLQAVPVQAPPAAAALQKTVGKYQVILRIPADGVFAGEPVDIEFRVLDTTDVDPVAGATGVVKVQTKATVTMPVMAGMPAQHPKVHTEGVPGDYGLECFFPHGGQYRIALSLVPPGESKPIEAAFLIDIQDAEARKGRKPVPLPYFVEVKPSGPVEAGKPSALTFTIRDTKTKAPVTDFDVAHTKLFHLLLASRDLSWFAHEHPEALEGGRFTLTQTFPAGGDYWVYADVAPRGAGSQILGTRIKVSGAAPKAVALTPSPARNTVEGLTAQLRFGASPVPVGQSTNLIFTLTDAGKAVTDLEPYLGAYGHLMIIHQDGQTVVHSHPAEDEAGVAQSQKGVVTFSARFPKPGIYKAWGQFQRGGKVTTIPFVLKVGGNV